MSAKFITIEGIEGVGKSSVIATLCATLQQACIDYVVTREPGGTPLGEAVRGVLLADYAETIRPLTEALLFFAAREQHIHQLIKPALAAQKWVLCDRFTDSSLAYQGGGRGVSDAQLDALVSWVQVDCIPDRTILLDAPIEIGLARIQARHKDRIERESIEFFKRVRHRYQQLAQENPTRYRIVNSDQPIEQVQCDVIAILQECIEST